MTNENQMGQRAQLPEELHEAVTLMVKGYNYGSGYYNDESFCKGLESLFILSGVYLDEATGEYRMPAPLPPAAAPAVPGGLTAERIADVIETLIGELVLDWRPQGDDDAFGSNADERAELLHQVRKAMAATPAPESQPASVEILSAALKDCATHPRLTQRQNIVRKALAKVAARSAPVPAAQDGPNADGWAKNTGTQPVGNDVRVEVEYRNRHFGGQKIALTAGCFRWSLRTGYDEDFDIIRWRPAAPVSTEGK